MDLEKIKSNIRFPEILDSLTGGVFITNPEGTILFWGRGAVEITGFTAQEAVGKHCSFFGTSTCGAFECNDDVMNCGLYQRGEIRNVRCTCRDKEGKIRHLLRSGSVIRGADNVPVGGIESLIDISDHVCAEMELSGLRRAVRERTEYGRLIGKSRSMQDIYDLIEEVADSSATVLVTGDSGTGKELIADAIHFRGPRRDKPFVKVNCSALPETLLESELFGHTRGAFTGAVADKAGRFETADGGTLFLDEIGEVTPAVQVKLLRVLQDKSFERVGSNRTLKVDVRIISATNRDLAARVKAGLFREDLFYRLNVIPVRVPPLRERAEDIPLLVNHFIDRFNRETGKSIRRIDEDALSLFLDYGWPGNIRELENAIEHAFVRTKGEVITIYSLPQPLRMVRLEQGARPQAPSLIGPVTIPYVGRPKLTREILEKGLAETGGNRGALAKKFGISRTTLWKEFRKFGID